MDDDEPARAGAAGGRSGSVVDRRADGQFRIPRAARALPFSGERLTSAVGGQIEIEHLHRYCLARDLCVGRDVLDVASGEGYGAALIAGVARRVLGLEIDRESVAHASAAYPLPNLRFVAGDAMAIPFAGACVDVVVSFETLEHLPDQERFLSEVRRVLRPGGLFLVSTPDRHVYSAPGQPPNRFHVLELTAPELSALLGAHFAHHRLLAQRALVGSVLTPLGRSMAATRSYDRRGEDTIEAQPGLSRAFYLIGAASDAPLPEIGASVYAESVPVDEALSAPALIVETQRLRDQSERLTADLCGRAEQIVATEARLRLLEAEALERERHVAALEATVARLLDTPMRRLARRMPWTARQVRRARNVVLWTLQGDLPMHWRAWRAARRARRLATATSPVADMRRTLGLPPECPVPAPEAIALPAPPDAPGVSILIPTYGQVDHTLRCLASLAAAWPETPTEVIVVDDASPDPRVAELARVSGIRLIRNPHNLGFLRTCNAAAREAQGELLFLLNNDTEVMPGAVDALVRLLETRPDAGLVGARLLFPDGTLQEAGGIIWADGSGWNYGRGDDPRRPEYNYVREADYCSGAAIMIPRALWEELGGFDERYLPAYCEDSDLAFRVRAAGRKVLYQPGATVIHHEGASHGTDTARGVKAHQVENQRKLAERWRAVLAAEHLPPGTRILRARDRARHRVVTLVIDHYIPEWDRDAGSRTIRAFLDALLASGRAVKFWPENGYPTPVYREGLQALGIEVLAGLPSLDAWLEQNGTEIDEVLVSRPSVAEWCLPILARRAAQARLVFYGHDLHFRRLQRAAEATGEAARRAEAEAWERRERAVWRAVDVVLYPSEEEAALVRAMAPGTLARAITPYALPAPIRRAAPPAGPPRLLFVAGFQHAPNIDAALWLVREIMPRLIARHAGLSLSLVGSKPAPEVQALAGPGVEVTGFVPDEVLAERYAAARVVMAPLRFGAGVKLKVVEALQQGVPLVTTPIGAEGIEGLSEVVDVTDDPEAFAAAVSRLIEDDALWLARATAQADFIQGRFSAEAMRAGLEEAFRLAGQSRASPKARALNTAS